MAHLVCFDDPASVALVQNECFEAVLEYKCFQCLVTAAPDRLHILQRTCVQGSQEPHGLSTICVVCRSLSSKVVSQYSNLLSPMAVDSVLKVLDPQRAKQ